MPRKLSHRDLTRATRTVAVAHPEAFQLMGYTAKGAQALWIWNSRDGVTPFGFSLDGVDYRHAMHSYAPSYSAILPDVASHVWVDYDRAAWAAMQAAKFEAFSASPDTGPGGGAEFLKRYPTIDAWLAVSPFEPGQPRRLSREEFLEWTSGYLGRFADGGQG
jgi:hypothetical protein